MMTASELVTAQIEAYNNRDLKANLDLFSETFQIIQFPSGAVLLNGKESCKEMYKNLFDSSPDLRAEVINRIDYDNKVILLEIIHGRNGSSTAFQQLIMFEIIGNKIERLYRF